MKKEVIRQAIYETLVYFDQFQYPMTREELYRYLWVSQSSDKITYVDFFDYLQDSDDDRIMATHGFWHLKDRGRIVEIRQACVVTVEKKMNIAIRAAKILRCIPFVRSVFVCNTLAGHIPSEESDIDVFIIIKKGHIWYARFLSNVVLKIVRMRTGKIMKDKICLSYFVVDSHLNMFSLQLPKPDIYMMYWILQLIPIYDPDDLYMSILRANMWIKEYIPHGLVPYQGVKRWTVTDSKMSVAIKKILSRWGVHKKWEHILKRLQYRHIRKIYGHILNYQDSRVMVSDHMLKFHENDRRQQYYDNWISQVT